MKFPWQKTKVVKLRPRARNRTFDSAQNSNMLTQWTTTSESINSVLVNQLAVLQARANDLHRNADHARSYVMTLQNNVLGPDGITYRPKVKNPSGKPDDLANAALSESFENWSQHYADITARHSFTMLQGAMLRNFAVDGEIIVRHIVGKTAGPYGYAIQLIDPSLLDPTHNVELLHKSGNKVRMSIELNEWDRPVAYYFLSDSLSIQPSANGKRYVRVPADEIIHAFVPEFGASQARGVPPMSAAMSRLKRLDSYEEAALDNARVGASKMGFYINPDGSAMVGEVVDDERVDEVEPGTFHQLPPGTTFQSFDPKYPEAEFAPFRSACLHSIASGLGLSANTLDHDLTNANYSSLRQGALDDRALYMRLQRFLIDSVLRSIQQHWVENAVLHRTVLTNGKPLKYATLDKYKAAQFVPRRFSWVDPLKDANAEIALIDANLKAPSQTVEELGGDWDEHLARLARDREQLAAIGATPKQAIQAIPEKEDDGEDKQEDD